MMSQIVFHVQQVNTAQLLAHQLWQQMIVRKDSFVLLDQHDLSPRVSLMEVCVCLVNIVQQVLALLLVVMQDLTVEIIYKLLFQDNVLLVIIVQEEVKINILMI